MAAHGPVLVNSLTSLLARDLDWLLLPSMLPSTRLLNNDGTFLKTRAISCSYSYSFVVPLGPVSFMGVEIGGQVDEGLRWEEDPRTAAEGLVRLKILKEKASQKNL